MSTAPPLAGTHETLVDAMDAAAVQLRDHDAYVEGDRRLTFGDWIDTADCVAAALRARGVRPGDVVALMLPPSIDYAICSAAAVRAGATVTGLNTRLGPREVDAIFERCRPALVIRDEALGLPPVPAPVAVLGRHELPGAAAVEPLGRARPSYRRDDPAVIIWTSGTTGLPKGAWFDHDGLRAAVASAGAMAAPFDRRLAATPFAHAGYMAKLWEQLAWAITLVISPTPWTAADTVRLLSEERITVAGAVPTQWAKVLEHPELAHANLSHLRLCLSATAPASPGLIAAIEQRMGSAVVVRYAMTESPSITGTDPDDPPELQHRTVGRPQAGVELELRDDANAPVPVGAVGRVHVRSAGAMRGYWRDPERTAAVFAGDGWLRSGDLGRLDGAGNLMLVGRASDMYIRGGYNVYPLEVERVLTEHAAIEQAAVVGVPAPVIGEIGVAFVVPASGAVVPPLEELRAWCRVRIADYKAPDRVVIVDAFPLTPMMKVDKSALRASALAHHGASPQR